MLEQALGGSGRKAESGERRAESKKAESRKQKAESREQKGGLLEQEGQALYGPEESCAVLVLEAIFSVRDVHILRLRLRCTAHQAGGRRRRAGDAHAVELCQYTLVPGQV